MKKLARKIIYNYVFKRLVTWFKGELVDQELVDAMYRHDIYFDIPESMSNKIEGRFKMSELKVYHCNELHNEYTEFYLKSDVDKVIEEKDKEIAELKAEIKRKEGVGQRWFERCMEARTENVGLKRALWLARANSARNSYLKWNLFANFESEEKLFTIDEYDETPGATDGQVLRTYTEWMKTWNNVERKCRAKAEEYK